MSILKKVFAINFIFVLLTTSFVAANSLNLTIDDAVAQAVKENLSIKKGDIALQSAKRSKTFSWNSVSPTISASGSISKAAPEQKKIPGSTNPASLSLGASINMGLSPSIVTSIKAAALNYEKEVITYDTTVRSIELNVRKAFYSILYEQDYVALQESNVKSALNQYNANQQKYNRGLLPRLDVLNSQISYQNAQLALDQAKTTLENDIATFKQLLGLNQDQEIVLSGTLDDIISITNVSIDGITPKSNTIASLEKQVEIARNSLNATRLSAYAPSLSAGYTYNMTSTTDDTSEWTKGGTIRLGVSIPLDGFLPWSKGAQSVANQKATLESAEIELKNQRQTLMLNIENSYNKVKQLEQTLKLRQQSIEYARETYNLTLEAYNSGTKDILALENARSSLLSAQVNLKKEAYSLAEALLNLENSLGLEFNTLAN